MKIELGSNYEFLLFDAASAEKWAINELKAEIKRLNLDYNIHALGIADVFDDGGWCFHSEDGVWLVYHSERGRRSGVSIFTSPFDGANFLLWKLVATPDGSNASVGLLPRPGV
jgi:hypothetical protein